MKILQAHNNNQYYVQKRLEFALTIHHALASVGSILMNLFHITEFISTADENFLQMKVYTDLPKFFDNLEHSLLSPLIVC